MMNGAEDLQLQKARDATRFIGLGIMGRPTCESLSKAGHRLTVNSRTLSSVERLMAQGCG